jgi:hypothetical protein
LCRSATLAGYEATHMIRKGQALEVRRHRHRFAPSLYFSVCSLRRAKFPIIFPDLRLDSKVATHPARLPAASE